MRKNHIVKVQRPLITSEPNPNDCTLVYSEDHEIHCMMNIEDVPKFDPGEAKYFAWAALNEAGDIIVNRRAPWQEW